MGDEKAGSSRMCTDQLSDAVYKKFYSDMPREQFEKQVFEKISASKKIVSSGEIRQQSLRFLQR